MTQPADIAAMPPRVTVRWVLYLDSTRYRWIAVSLPYVAGLYDDEVVDVDHPPERQSAKRRIEPRHAFERA